jgi:autotransporter-associated beta strand protein
LEALTLNGPGTSLPNDGALQNINSDNTWAGLIVLGSQAAIGSDLNTLTITGQIVDTGNGYGIVAPSLGYGVTKVGPDIVQFKPGQGNTYTGPTLVDDGTLQLNNQGGAGTYAVKGNLTVGDGNGNLLTDIAILMGDNQINPSSTLTVNSDGLFNLNGKMQTIAGLTMTGGTVDVKGGQLTLGGNVTAQADSTGAPAIITDTNFATPGSVLLGPSGVTNRTFTVNRTGTGLPVLPADMVISAVLNQANPTVTDLTKLGAGTLQLTRSNLYTGLTHPTAGVLVVDGTIADVELNGGTLAGTGTVGNITTTAAGGTVAPGDLPAPGALTCTSVTWNITDLFHLLLSPPGYSGQSNRLIVTGNVVLGDADPGPGGLYNINNAKLDPSSEVGTTAEGNAFLIMTYTGTLTGHFLEQYSSNTVFLAGQKFSVDYTTTPGQIWLTRTLNTATLTLTPSLTSPILYGQDISFTATVTPEPGASASLTTSDQVAFTFSVHGGPTSVSYVNLNSSGQATLDPKIFFGNLPVPVVVGTPNYYDVTVDFTKDGYTSPPSETSSLQVNPTATSVNVSSTWSTAPSPLVYGQTVTITATVSPKSTVPPQLPSALRPSGTVTFTVDPGPSQQQVSAVLDTNGQASINLPGDLPSLTTGSHTVQVAYVDLSGGGDGNYQDSNTLAGYLVTVSRGPVDFSILPDPLSSSFGEPVTLTATVTARSPSTGTTQQRVVVEGTPGVDTFSLSLDGGATFISETCGVSDSQLQTDLNDYLNTNFPGGIYGTATVSQFNNNTYLVTFFGGTTPPPLMENLPAGTATVTIDTTSNPGGKVYFYDGSIPLGWSDVDINTGQASINTILTVGTHTINAAYSPDSNYSSASASYTNYVVSKGDTTTTIISSPNYSVYGQIVTVTATVTIGAAHNPFVPQTGIANGTVSFYLDGGTTPIGTTGVDNTGKAKVLLSSTLGIGTHQITATYNGNANFNASDPSDVLDQVVKSATTSTLGVTPTSSPYYGLQTVTLTATVKPSGTGAGVAPTGSVNFYDGSTLLNPTPIPVNVVSGTTVQAEFTLSYPTNPLAAGSHQLKAVYLGDGDPYYSSSTSPTKLYTVLQAVTTTSLVVTPGDPTGYGDQLTFTATIGLAPSQGGGTPTGAVNFVNFYDGATLLNPSPVPLTGNQAEFTTITPLAKGSHSIQARYTSDDANYKNSVSALVSRTVTLATTTTTLTPGLASPATYGNASMTFTATVDPTNPLSGTPTGSVEFYDGATKIATVPLTGGQAVLTPPPFLTGGLHNLQARYTGNPSAFSGSNSTVLTDYQVDKAATTTTLSSSAPGSIGQGQSVTFTAVVSGVGTAPGVANPTGTVVFYDGGIAKYTFNLTSTSGPAKWTTSSLIFGTHTITATYNPGSNPNYLTSTSDPLEQKVLKPTSTSVVAAPTSSTYGGLVTFTATVISTTNGGNPTSGTVTFYDGATQIGTPVDLIGTNQASINTNTLTGGAHTIKAVYSGDGTTYAASTGMRSFTVNRAVSSITVDLPAPTSSTYGQQVTLTATVSPTTLPLTATGTVTFKANNVIVGIYILQAADAGVATLQVTNIGAGTKTITATYSGDTNFTADSTSNTQSLTVNKAQSTTVVTSSAPGNTTPYGQLVNFYVTVTNKDYPAVGTPSGTVTFWDGPVGTGIKLNTTPVSLNAAGIAALSTGALSEGVHDINASFTAASSGNFLNSESEVALEYTVTASQVASLTASLLNSSGKAVTSVATNTAFSISVLARDASGNTLTTYSAPVTMTTITAPAGGVLTGRFSSTFINGKATFAGLKATKAGTYTVKVTSGGKETTFTFTVTATGRLL